tara:strand:- start:165 stop:323 length:159 start_codon:yes stop_codon:yes gene_type:complete
MHYVTGIILTINNTHILQNDYAKLAASQQQATQIQEKGTHGASRQEAYQNAN